ncbi:methyltransferase domain-containing protein [Spirulina major CS-329]|uniref:methyltransferase domain-containing protein n=1 Tax=Spirulina TaxID=1154 RepID=UPI00232D7957|nr:MULTISPECIES: methyltransferase domain-containing protein [Spirulina]MDB9496767.1 methyltransferase domain-containing protein [Spirulina subsalsa CS-330]MDB9505291.1 methyltransferase domain-containing protein [Spirulina major CS-329]
MTLPLSEKIRRFYDTTSGLWEKIWGEHMHHGYYGRAGLSKCDRRQAQVDLIEELLAWGNIQAPRTILDVGCGIGGSTLHLARKYQANATGVTLSPIQAGRAKERALEAGLTPHVDFQVADALALPFADQSFDLVWSLESGEHMPDKQQFLRECYRVLKPGGTLLLATWCHRPADQIPLTPSEQHHLSEIYRVYHLPYVIALPEYRDIATQLGFQAVRCEDWSTAVAPFWDVVIDSALAWEAVTGLVQLGGEAIEAALSLRLMSSGYERGLVRFGLLCGQR